MEIVSLVVAFVSTIQLVLVFHRIAPKIGLIDNPGGRKDHVGAVPLVGGLAMFLAFVLSFLVSGEVVGHERALLIGATLLVFIGVLDDLHELSSTSRFAVQISVALIMVFLGDVVLRDLGHLVSSDSFVQLGIVAVPLTVFAVVGVVNAMNMVDGVDGLAGSLGAATLLALIVVALHSGDIRSAKIMGMLLATILAFLLFNLRFPWQPRAHVFMGDAGSMFIGFVLAWYLVDFAQGEDRKFSPATALWLFGLPLIDTVTMMLRRTLKGRSPFAPDREHFHHVLQLAGFSPGATLLIMLGLTLLMSSVGLAAHYMGVPEPYMFYGFLVIFAGHYLMMHRAWKVMRFLRRSIDRRARPTDRRYPDKAPAYNGEERRTGSDRRSNKSAE